MVGRPRRCPDRTTAVNSGRRRRRACAGNTSGGELLATLAPTAGDDRPPGASAHPQPEAVRLGPTAVVRLEGALAHEVLLLHDIGGRVPAGRRARSGQTPGSWFPARANGGQDVPAPLRGALADSDQHSRGSRPAGEAPTGPTPQAAPGALGGTEARRGDGRPNSVRRAGERLP